MAEKEEISDQEKLAQRIVTEESRLEEHVKKLHSRMLVTHAKAIEGMGGVEEYIKAGYKFTPDYGKKVTDDVMAVLHDWIMSGYWNYQGGAFGDMEDEAVSMLYEAMGGTPRMVIEEHLKSEMPTISPLVSELAKGHIGAVQKRFIGKIGEDLEAMQDYMVGLTARYGVEIADETMIRKIPPKILYQLILDQPENKGKELAEKYPSLFKYTAK